MTSRARGSFHAFPLGAVFAVELPTTLMTPGLIVVALAAAMARAFGQSRVIVCVLAIGSTIPAVVMARVVVDTAQDPTSHNLWPFEIILSGFVGVFIAAAGALIGSIPQMAQPRRGT